jgi:predicted GTPase
MQAVDMDMHVKILVVGNGGVGKSSLLARYCEVASVAPGQTLDLAEWHYLSNQW